MLVEIAKVCIVGKSNFLYKTERHITGKIVYREECFVFIHIQMSGLLNFRDANTGNIMHTFHMVFVQPKEG
jgi:hypothetical protein